MKNKSIFFLFLILILLGQVNHAKSDNTEVKFEPTDDAYVDSTNPDSNYKNADLKVMYIETSTIIFSYITYLAFSTNIPLNSSISNVKLEISVKYMPYDDHTVPIKVWLTSGFSENTLIFKNAPNLGKLLGSISIDADKRWTISLSSSYLTDSIKNGKVYLALTTDVDNAAPITFDSKSDSFNPPKLVVTYNKPFSRNPDYVYGSDSPPDGVIGLMIIFAIIAVVGSFYYLKTKNKRKNYKSNQGAFYSPYNIQQPVGRFCSRCGKPKQNINEQFCNYCGAKHQL